MCIYLFCMDVGSQQGAIVSNLPGSHLWSLPPMKSWPCQITIQGSEATHLYPDELHKLTLALCIVYTQSLYK